MESIRNIGQANIAKNDESAVYKPFLTLISHRLRKTFLLLGKIGPATNRWPKGKFSFCPKSLCSKYDLRRLAWVA